MFGVVVRVPRTPRSRDESDIRSAHDAENEVLHRLSCQRLRATEMSHTFAFYVQWNRLLTGQVAL